MTPEEFREKWNHLSEERIGEAVEFLVKEVVLPAIENIDVLTFHEAAFEVDLNDELTEFAIDVYRDERFRQFIEKEVLDTY